MSNASHSDKPVSETARAERSAHSSAAMAGALPRTRPLLSITASCFNEEENIEEFYKQVIQTLQPFLDRYDYELLFIDNCSTDSTVDKVRNIIRGDDNVWAIVNARNFGQVRSPYYGLQQTQGDAVISIATDLQDPPALIAEFIKKWEQGYKNVLAVKCKTHEFWLMSVVRKLFYNIIAGISDTPLIKNFTGFGLYDRSFINVLKELNDPYPYLRGLVAEFAADRVEVSYTQPMRKKGESSNTLFTLYDMAILGFINHSKLPLRISSFAGFGISLLSFLAALAYLIYKLLFWDTFQVGVAPLVISVFFFAGVQLFFMGIIGEYVGAIFTEVKNHPLVLEKERINHRVRT